MHYARPSYNEPINNDDNGTHLPDWMLNFWEDTLELLGLGKKEQDNGKNPADPGCKYLCRAL